jgi:hypothetical protein
MIYGTKLDSPNHPGHETPDRILPTEIDETNDYDEQPLLHAKWRRRNGVYANNPPE